MWRKKVVHCGREQSENELIPIHAIGTIDAVRGNVFPGAVPPEERGVGFWLDGRRGAEALLGGFLGLEVSSEFLNGWCLSYSHSLTPENEQKVINHQT